MTNLNEELFESTVNFEDDAAPTKENTPEDAYKQAFEQEMEGMGDAGEQPPSQRLFERLSDEELQAVLDKAKLVDDLNERLRKTHDSAFGRIGSIENTIKELRESKPTQAPIDASLFKNLREYLGEDAELVEALAQDLSAMQLGIPLTPNFDLDLRFEQEKAAIQEQQQAFQDNQTALRQEFEMKLLTMQHPDWREINTSPEFAEWQGTLKPEDRQRLASTWDGIELSSAFSKFKGWKAKKAEFEANKQRRLDSNIPVRGNGYSRPNMNYDNDFERGFYEGAGIDT
jgi:hypothetical protein